MLCERCGIRQASVRVRRTSRGRQEEFSLCGQCSSELGMRAQTPFGSNLGFRDFFGGPFEYESRADEVSILDAFSERAKAVVQRAGEVAQDVGVSVIDTEHILVGVAEEADVGRKVLERLDVKPDELVGYLRANMAQGASPREKSSQMNISPRAKQALELAWHAARDLGHDYVGSEHIAMGLLEEGEGFAAQTLKKYGLSETALRQAVLAVVGKKGAKTGKVEASSNTPTLDAYSRDLTAFAQDGKLDPVIGRSKEVTRVIQILSRRKKNNPVLIGDPGIGKTAIVEGLAARIVNGNVPDTLKGKRLLSLDIAAMVAGSKYRGEFEERLKKVIDEVEKHNETLLLFIDELHIVVGAGSGGEGGMDAANILKPALARGELKVIGATTLAEYRKYIEKDGALERRFQPVLVGEPTIEEAIEILRGLKDRYEAHHKVSITDSAIVSAVTLSDKYIRDRYLPDKAIDLIDEAAARVRIGAMEPPADLSEKEERVKVLQRELASEKRAKNTAKVTDIKNNIDTLEQEISKERELWQKRSGTAFTEVESADVEHIVSAWTGIPVEKLSESERDKLLHLEDELHKIVIAQDEAVRAVSEAIRRNMSGLKDPDRPQGSFLFLGPTGVGKTELARALAQVLFGDRDALIRLDMSEYMERHTVSRMIGSPPGYVGYDEGGQLTEIVRRKPHSVILLDEIEKAHGDVWNILLQVLEDGRLTDAKGRLVDFRNTLIIMTSNLGSEFIQQSMMSPQDEKIWERTCQLVMDKVKTVFRPEFVNRVDEIVVFHPLDKIHVQKIADILLAEVIDRVRQQGIFLHVAQNVRNRLAQDGFDPALGARPLRREIQKKLENTLSEILLRGAYPLGSHIEAILEGDKISFREKSEKQVDNHEAS